MDSRSEQTLLSRKIKINYDDGDLVRPSVLDEAASGRYESCCFRLDRQFVTFVVQTGIGLSVLSFCAMQLATITDCNRATPYWGLVGTITGFFFRKMSLRGK